MARITLSVLSVSGAQSRPAGTPNASSGASETQNGSGPPVIPTAPPVLASRVSAVSQAPATQINETTRSPNLPIASPDAQALSKFRDDVLEQLYKDKGNCINFQQKLEDDIEKHAKHYVDEVKRWTRKHASRLSTLQIDETKAVQEKHRQAMQALDNDYQDRLARLRTMAEGWEGALESGLRFVAEMEMQGSGRKQAFSSYPVFVEGAAARLMQEHQLPFLAKQVAIAKRNLRDVEAELGHERTKLAQKQNGELAQFELDFPRMQATATANFKKMTADKDAMHERFMRSIRGNGEKELQKRRAAIDEWLSLLRMTDVELADVYSHWRSRIPRAKAVYVGLASGWERASRRAKPKSAPAKENVEPTSTTQLEASTSQAFVSTPEATTVVAKTTTKPSEIATTIAHAAPQPQAMLGDLLHGSVGAVDLPVASVDHAQHEADCRCVKCGRAARRTRASPYARQVLQV